ncbi:MAG: alpha/beta fold hydrolase, partial [Spirulinaceae cyanobacterium]
MSINWQQRIGNQRDWVWRGWQTRYSFVRPLAFAQQSKTPLILLHGFGASIEHWRSNLPILGKEHNVYALDLLGFGGSKKAHTDYSIALWVEQVYDFWQTFIQRPVVLVGNSLGSLVCFAAAAAHPDMVAGIAMISVPDTSLLQKNLPRWVKSLEAKTKSLIAFPPLLKMIFKVVRQPKVISVWAKVA